MPYQWKKPDYEKEYVACTEQDIEELAADVERMYIEANDCTYCPQISTGDALVLVECGEVVVYRVERLAPIKKEG